MFRQLNIALNDRNDSVQTFCLQCPKAILAIEMCIEHTSQKPFWVAQIEETGSKCFDIFGVWCQIIEQVFVKSWNIQRLVAAIFESLWAWCALGTSSMKISKLVNTNAIFSMICRTSHYVKLEMLYQHFLPYTLIVNGRKNTNW